MTTPGCVSVDALMCAYVEHLRGVRGLRERTVELRLVHVRRFVRAVCAGDPATLDVSRLDVAGVLGFFLRAMDGLGPRTVGMIATSLRSFLRFLRQEGLVDGRLEAAIPVVARPRLAALPAGLADSDLTRLLAATAASATPCAVRDHAIVTCLAALGLRPGELADLRLDDVDWRAGTLCVGAGKTRRGRVLPLPRDAGRALVVYLRTQRPVTSERRVFVQHRTAARGAALSSLAITQAVARALRRAGIEARIRGAYVLRHTLACRLVRHGTSLVEIADVLGHRSLDTTAVYARVDLAALREVALPWPAVTP